MSSAGPAPAQGSDEPEEFPGDVHWYDLPDDDAEPDEGPGRPAWWA